MIKLEHEGKVFVSIILNFVSPVAEKIRQSSDEVKMRLISQLVNGISKVPQKLPKDFNGTTISTSFVSPAAEVFHVILTCI